MLTSFSGVSAFRRIQYGIGGSLFWQFLAFSLRVSSVSFSRIFFFLQIHIVIQFYNFLSVIDLTLQNCSSKASYTLTLFLSSLLDNISHVSFFFWSLSCSGSEVVLDELKIR